MKVGYARVSTQEQNLDLQLTALERAGCEKTFRDRGTSGMQRDRPQLSKAIKTLEKGDVLVVWKLDRLGRSLGHLIDLVGALKERGVGFASISENIDTTSPGGKLFFHMIGALAEFERDLIVERTKAGMDAARRRGQHLGRPPKLGHSQLAAAKNLLAQGESRNQVARILKVDPSTLYRNLNKDR